jgi:hypothetical protein
MESLTIVRTDETPGIEFSKKSGVLRLHGRSIPENANTFYQPVIQWIRSYVEKPATETILKVELDYLNSISQKMLLDIMQYLAAIRQTGNHVVVEWHYESDDEEMLEEGHIFESKVSLPFSFISVTI